MEIMYFDHSLPTQTDGEIPLLQQRERKKCENPEYLPTKANINKSIIIQNITQ